MREAVTQIELMCSAVKGEALHDVQRPFGRAAYAKGVMFLVKHGGSE
jgi:hypothetical protein